MRMLEEEIFKELLRLLHKSKTDPAIIYAFKKTRRLVSAQTRAHLSPKERKEWDDAIDEYYAKLKNFTNPDASKPSPKRSR